MPARLPKALLIAVGFALALAACSRIDLAYRNLDRLVPWSLDDYLDMNREQKTLLDDRLREHLAWHCKTQLPGYLDWLDRVRDMVADDQVTDQALQQRTREAREAIGRVAEEITPSATGLLRGMSDTQVAEMRDAFREDISERQKQYVDTPLPKQIARRTERMEKRLTPWLGEPDASAETAGTGLVAGAGRPEPRMDCQPCPLAAAIAAGDEPAQRRQLRTAAGHAVTAQGKFVDA